MDDELLLVEEICDKYRVTLIYVRKLIREHKIKSVKHGRTYIVRKDEWEKYFYSKEV